MIKPYLKLSIADGISRDMRVIALAGRKKRKKKGPRLDPLDPWRPPKLDLLGQSFVIVKLVRVL